MATIPTATIVATAQARYPLGSAPDAVLEAWVAQARAQAGYDGFTDAHLLAMAHLVGHYAEMWLRATSGGSSTGGGGGTAGVVTSSRSSTLAVSFGAMAGSGAWSAANATDGLLSQTPAGQAYLMLRDSRAEIVAPWVV